MSKKLKHYYFCAGVHGEKYGVIDGVTQETEIGTGFPLTDLSKSLAREKDVLPKKIYFHCIQILTEQERLSYRELCR